MNKIISVIFLSMSLLVGCATPQDILLENPDLPTSDKITLIGGETDINLISYSNEEKCVTLVECAIYIHDHELTKWLLEKSKMRESYYIDYDDGHKIRHVVLQAIDLSRSDEEALSNIKLLTDYGYQTNVCGYGYISPMNLAYRRGYVKTFKYMLSKMPHSDNGIVKVDEGIRCELPWDLDVKSGKNLTWRYSLGARHYAIKDFNGKPAQIEMFKSLMDVSENLMTDYGMAWERKDSCAKNSKGLLLYVAECENKLELASFIRDYIKNNNDMSQQEKLDVLKKMDDKKEEIEADKKKQAIAQEKYDRYVARLHSSGSSTVTDDSNVWAAAALNAASQLQRGTNASIQQSQDQLMAMIQAEERRRAQARQAVNSAGGGQTVTSNSTSQAQSPATEALAIATAVPPTAAAPAPKQTRYTLSSGAAEPPQGTPAASTPTTQARRPVDSQGVAQWGTLARTEGEGKLSGSFSPGQVRVGDCQLTGVNLHYDIGYLGHEPVVKGKLAWQPAAGTDKSCLPDNLWAWLRLENGNAVGYVWLLTASPNWDRFICGFQGGQRTDCFSAEQAKQFIRGARVTGYRLSLE